MIFLYGGIALLVLLALLCPFLCTREKRLVSCYSVNDPQVLQQMREQILRQYLRDEQAWQQGHIGVKVWQKRQAFLRNRYLDVCRRYDYLAQPS